MAQETITEPTDPLTLKSDLSAALDHVDQHDDLNAVERRTLRARTQPMLVLPTTDAAGVAQSEYLVFSASGSEYTVDLERGSCTCPDDGDHDKHLIRVLLSLDETPLPAPGEDATDYWDWFFETVREVTQYLDGLSDDLRRSIIRALGTARSESGDHPKLKMKLGV